MLKNKGLIPILKNSEFKLVHPIDARSWLATGWQIVDVWQQKDSDFLPTFELEGEGIPFNPPPIPQKSYSYWDTQNNALYWWDVRDRGWVLLSSSENQSMSPVEIRDSLSSLSPSDRLDSSAIKNLPTAFSPPIPIADVTNLQTSLDSKASTIHNHAIADISGLGASLANKANLLHDHAIADIENLQNSLDSKALTSHQHSTSDISGLSDLLSAYAPLDGAVDLNSYQIIEGQKRFTQAVAVSAIAFPSYEIELYVAGTYYWQPSLSGDFTYNSTFSKGKVAFVNDGYMYSGRVAASNISSTGTSPVKIESNLTLFAEGVLNVIVYQCDGGLTATSLIAEAAPDNQSFLLYYPNSSYRPVLSNEIGTYIDLSISGVVYQSDRNLPL